MYINCHTYYSLRYGVLSVTALLELAKKFNLSSLALTDINSTSACLEFIREAKKEGVRPVVGADIRNGNNQCYVLLAKDNEGYNEINDFIAHHIHNSITFPKSPTFSSHIIRIYPFEKILEEEIKVLGPDDYIGVSLIEARKIQYSTWRNDLEKQVLLLPVSFRHQIDYNIHRLLRCIDLNIVLSQLPEIEQGDLSHTMKSHDVMQQGCNDYPHVFENTVCILNQCSIYFGFDANRENQNQDSFLSPPASDFEYLKSLVRKKINLKYPVVTDKINDRIVKELNAIRDMGFVSYFLINHDIIQYAISKEYPYIGRGSGANSVIAYILGITNVDPIELDLYFERFINLYRSSPPDFDIDFSWKDRDDITAYIFQRYPNTALMGTYVTFQYKAVIRELAKVFGIPKEEIDAFLKGYIKNSANDRYFKLVIKYGKRMHGFPNYLSVHSGGIVITKRPVHWFCGTFLPPKGFPTLQIDMHIAESTGIFKFDILAQRGLSKIKDTLEIIAYNQPGVPVMDMENINAFKKDPQINALLKEGDCTGVFYVESPAMRTLMIKLKTSCYLDLVAASSIIRPGVSNGGMKNAYIERHRFPEKRKGAHPILLEIMPETYGVMVYQEDVLKVAHRFAGLSLGEADILRRGMSGKGRSIQQFLDLEKKFFTKCDAKGYTRELSQGVWDQIKAFAGYAFAKGHSASYAVESYQSLYLKKYFPLEFMTAVLNNGGGFYNVDTYLNEIKKMGGIVEAPCINNSDHMNVIKGKTVYLGFGMIKDLQKRAVQQILTQRQLYGLYQDFDDFLNRCRIGLEQLLILIRIRAFRAWNENKHALMWRAHLHAYKETKHDDRLLFKPQIKKYSLPDMDEDILINAYDNLDLLGYSLANDFQLIRPLPCISLLAANLVDYKDKTIEILGKLVTYKTTKTVKGEVMYFSTFLDQQSQFFDVVHFPNVVQKHPKLTWGIYWIKGEVKEDLGYFGIICQDINKIPFAVDPRLI